MKRPEPLTRAEEFVIFRALFVISCTGNLPELALDTATSPRVILGSGGTV